MRKFRDRLGLILIVKFAVLYFMTELVFSYKGQLCFCDLREFFFNHCYFDDENFNNYLCYNLKDHQNGDTGWLNDAKEDFKKFYEDKGKPDLKFGVEQRTIIECIHSYGNSY